MSTAADVSLVAKTAVASRRQGSASVNLNGHIFDLNAGGMCARFVRQCYEAALKIPDFTWEYRASDARQMERALRAAGLATSSPQPGDIVCFNNQSYVHGHIGIWVGEGQVAENTSSGSRGDPRPPGTKLTPLASIGEAKVSGYYSLLPGLGVVLLPGSTLIDCDPRLEGDTTRVNLRAVSEALGYNVIPHLNEGRIYLQPRGVV